MKQKMQELLKSHKIQDLHIEWLKNCPQAIPTLVDWAYEEWKPFDTTLTKERLTHSYQQRLNDDKLPFTLVALKQGRPIGTISLKAQGEPELSSLSQGNPWIGSLHVIENERNKGIGTELLRLALSISKNLGFSHTFVYTSNPDNVAWYTEHDAEVLETCSFRNHTITIMKM